MLDVTSTLVSATVALVISLQLVLLQLFHDCGMNVVDINVRFVRTSLSRVNCSKTRCLLIVIFGMYFSLTCRVGAHFCRTATTRTSRSYQNAFVSHTTTTTRSTDPFVVCFFQNVCSKRQKVVEVKLNPRRSSHTLLTSVQLKLIARPLRLLSVSRQTTAVQHSLSSATDPCAESEGSIPGRSQLVQLAISSLCKRSDPSKVTSNSQESNNSNDRKSIAGRSDEDEWNMESRLSYFGGIPYTKTGHGGGSCRVAFVLGGPGAGKGTQCERMIQEYPVVHYSVGQLLRDATTSTSESPYRQIIQDTLASGAIVPVEISLQLLQEAMKRDNQQKDVLMVVDGFPRNYDNLAGWCKIMKDTTQLKSVFVYQCPLHVLEERILQRAAKTMSSGQQQRSDDNKVALQKRFRTFEMETVPVIDVLREATNTASSSVFFETSDSGEDFGNNASHRNHYFYDVVDIRADRPVDDVWECTRQTLDRLIADDVLTATAALLQAIDTNNYALYQQLCDASWLQAKSTTTSSNDMEDESIAKNVMDQREALDSVVLDNIVQNWHATTSVTNATLRVVSGKQVAVSYKRHYHSNPNSGDFVATVNEERIWSHRGGTEGWKLMNAVRTPVQATASSYTETTDDTVAINSSPTLQSEFAPTV